MKLGIVLVTLITVSVVSASADAHTWYIKPDGTGDAPTIQAGIDLTTPGDIVLLANGTYTGAGNRDIDYCGKAITVRAESGNPELCIIDCEQAGRGFYFHSQERAGSVLEGVTIRNGRDVSYGGGMCLAGSSPTVAGCAFSGNSGPYGGGMCCWVSSPSVVDCTFSGNSASSGGGGMCLMEASATVTGCTFSGNSAPVGAGVFYSGIAALRIDAVVGTESNTIILERTIIAFSTAGEAVYSCPSGGGVTVTCCDIYGNAGGDWVGCIADQNNINGNFSANPMFCGRWDGDFCVDYLSPCAPGRHPYGYDCGVIGAYGVGCDHPTNTFPKTWGAIKAMYK